MHDATRQPPAHRLEAYSPKRPEDAGSHHSDLIECASMTEPGAGGSDQPQITQQLVNLVPFAGMVGAELMSATPEQVKGRLEWSEERCTAGGVLHGGALMTLADTLGALCAFLNLPPPRRPEDEHDRVEEQLLQGRPGGPRRERLPPAACWDLDDSGADRPIRRGGQARRADDADPGSDQRLNRSPYSPNVGEGWNSQKFVCRTTRGCSHLSFDA